MSELHVTTLTGGEATLQDTVLTDLKAQLRGPLLLPGDDGYDTTRQLWTGFLSKNPDGTSLNPAVATGMIGHSSGRG